MDRLFDASREAYKQGDGAEAKELSNRAKALKEEKEKINRQAADWIFERGFRICLVDRRPRECLIDENAFFPAL